MSIDDAYEELAENNYLSRVTKNETCYYNEEGQKLTGYKKMSPCDKRIIEKELYAMAYAYEKSGKTEEPSVSILKKN